VKFPRCFYNLERWLDALFPFSACTVRANTREQNPVLSYDNINIDIVLTLQDYDLRKMVYTLETTNSTFVEDNELHKVYS
jgi:hypothetical protein